LIQIISASTIFLYISAKTSTMSDDQNHTTTSDLQTSSNSSGGIVSHSKLPKNNEENGLSNLTRTNNIFGDHTEVSNEALKPLSRDLATTQQHASTERNLPILSWETFSNAQAQLPSKGQKDEKGTNLKGDAVASAPRSEKNAKENSGKEDLDVIDKERVTYGGFSIGKEELLTRLSLELVAQYEARGMLPIRGSRIITGQGYHPQPAPSLTDEEEKARRALIRARLDQIQ
jgi:hypothetical protein